MGMYIVPPGGKPLTCLEIPLPGPADYTPKADLTKGSLPQYSIVGRPKTPPVNKKSPGPADYNTSGNLIWKRRSVTLKRRGRSCFEDEVAKSNGDVGSIKVENLGVGTGGPKYSVGMKRSKIFTGPPNSLVQPQDYSAFDTPGPNYRPNSAYWGRGPKKSFGAGRDDIDLLDSRISYPGPGDYVVYSPPVGPSYSFGRKLPPPPSVLEDAILKDLAYLSIPLTLNVQRLHFSC
ncbi:hypothetical protein CHS0354_013394 [Potamilus streckersoni]|uniref:Uncharacterized protein n=1 Tax=Potamilus streckersoni TaxID=2493646 RepID=A0AAE0VJI6_9BIVA|nr:hypothetical protein CHS0354_013394 [Potamilus streckersoni]